MKSYIEAIDNLPTEFRWPLVKAFEIFREEIADTVKKEDFDDLKAVLAELAEAQKKTEARLNELAEAQKKTEARLNELAEAQKKTEARLNELAEAQKKTEVRLNELAEAQKKTEQRLSELAEAQKKTEVRLETIVAELAEAQKKTEQAIQKLTQEQMKIKEELGGISHTVGYRLEDEAMKALPSLLKQDFGVEVLGRLKRDFIEIGKDNYIEVNIFGEGRKNGKDYAIIGEAKSQLKKKNIDDFLKKVENLKRYIPNELILLYVTYIAHPQIKKYAEGKNIKIYFSYEL